MLRLYLVPKSKTRIFVITLKEMFVLRNVKSIKDAANEDIIKEKSNYLTVVPTFGDHEESRSVLTMFVWHLRRIMEIVDRI